jgi:DNA invertase Pin-like site-specific DNA recombinase
VFPRLLGVFAEFETNLRRERQLEGIASAKARGVYKGRKPSIDLAKIKKMKADGTGASAIAKALKIGRASVYRALAD